MAMWWCSSHVVIGCRGLRKSTVARRRDNTCQDPPHLRPRGLRLNNDQVSCDWMERLVLNLGGH